MGLLNDFLGVFSFCLLVLSYSDLILFYILFYYTLDACLFSNKRQEGGDLDEGTGREELEGINRGKTVVRIYCMKTSIFNKRKSVKLPWLNVLYGFCILTGPRQ